MFEADVNYPAANGMSALSFAAAAGRLDVIDLLLRYKPVVSYIKLQNVNVPVL